MNKINSTNQIPDEVFAQALSRLAQGQSPKAIAADFAEYQHELEGLLFVAQAGMQIPKLTPPTPYKAYRFADSVATSSVFSEWFAYFRIAAIPIALVIVLVGGGKLADATKGSLPGDNLYSLKRATENARLTLTRDQDKVASLHVEFMQNRINEVKQAANEGNEETETLAIAELKTQTDKTFAEAGPVATANAISKQDSTLLDTLVAVNKQQKDVLEELSETGESDTAKTVAISALEDNKKNDVTLARMIATVNDQAMADMPNKVSVTGNITYYTYNKITVEKNIFTINDRTTITGIDGQNITNISADLKTISGRVTIIGTRMENDVLIAKQILLLATDIAGDQDGEVKGDTTTTYTKPITKPADQIVPAEPAPTTPATPTKATGSYITEPSGEQYAP